MQKLIDLTGKQFGRWTVIQRAPAVPGKPPYWFCVCDCPPKTIKMVEGGSLRRGMSTSCGCEQRAGMSSRKLKHGGRRVAEPGSDVRVTSGAYQSWSAMRTRCLNPNGAGYPNYGGRGITVCERWNSFQNFLEDMGPRPRGQSLDRIDVNGTYTKENCRWATSTEQMLNRRTSRRSLTDEEIAKILEMLHDGKPRSEVAKAFGIKPRAVKTIRDNAVASGNWKPTRRFLNKSLSDEDVVEANRRVRAGESIPSIAAHFNVHPITIRRRLDDGYDASRG
jgi:Helix-turn-helix domain